jgi:hypothetical protein
VNLADNHIGNYLAEGNTNFHGGGAGKNTIDNYKGSRGSVTSFF